MPTIIVKVHSSNIDPIELRDAIQEILEEELPYVTDGAVHTLTAIYDDTAACD